MFYCIYFFHSCCIFTLPYRLFHLVVIKGWIHRRCHCSDVLCIFRVQQILSTIYFWVIFVIEIRNFVLAKYKSIWITCMLYAQPMINVSSCKQYTILLPALYRYWYFFNYGVPFRIIPISLSLSHQEKTIDGKYLLLESYEFHLFWKIAFAHCCHCLCRMLRIIATILITFLLYFLLFFSLSTMLLDSSRTAFVLISKLLCLHFQEVHSIWQN